MSIKVHTAAVVGLDAEIVEVEADTGGGDFGTFTVVGLPDTAVNEARERVRSAIKNSGLDFPRIKVTVNLAPADLKKQGPAYDLPIALAVLTATKRINWQVGQAPAIFVGELALDGALRGVNGVLPVAIKAAAAGFKELYVPRANIREAKLVSDLTVYPLDNLRQLIDHLEGRQLMTAAEAEEEISHDWQGRADLAHVRGQEHAKRALEIAAAGGHNLMMCGTPGSGKTMIARALPSILPDLSRQESLEVTKIYSVAGLLPSEVGLVSTRPFRSPHHSSSGVALVGGGTWPKPGEISLAHRGVLFLDEFGEFPKSVLENLRQPLEDGIVHISRAAGTLRFPAKFILVAAMNPCPCGYYGDPDRHCTCSQSQILNYRKRISGPILDRIDLHVPIKRVEYDKLAGEGSGESSADIKRRIISARQRQAERFNGQPFITNSEMDTAAVKASVKPDADSAALLKTAVEKLHLSARSYFRILKVARTIADLAGQEKTEVSHIAEALQYRPS